MWFRLSRVVVFLLAAAIPVSAQYYYGKNKVQREVETTYTLETEHFTIYVEEGGEPLAQFAADVVEEAYRQHSADFGFDLPVKTPVIIYKSGPDFAATNIILEPIEESIGGFAEIFKNRAVVPFTGSYTDLRHVLFHELVHIFQYELYFSLTMSNLFSIIPGFTPPLWIMEGCAEFSSSHGGDVQEAFMRDLLLTNNIIPLEELEYWGGYIVYRQGESVFLFIEERYGRDKVFELMHAMKLRGSMDGAFQKVFGMNVEDFGADWLNWLRKRYLPDIDKLGNMKTQARLLTDHEKDFTYYTGSVALSPNGSKVAYASTGGDYLKVKVISGFDGKELKTLLRAGRTATFERLPLLRSNMSWSPDEDKLAVIGFSRNRPVLLWVDYSSGKTVGRYRLNVDDAYAPAVSPDGSRIVFVGIKGGESDLYSLDLKSGGVERLTYDIYEEQDPSFDGELIIYSSDKPEADSVWEIGNYAVWQLSPSGRTKRITPRLSRVSSPHVIDGKIVFIGPGFQLFSYNREDSTLARLTEWFQKVEEFSPAQSGKAAMIIYNNSGYDVGMLNGIVQSLESSQDTLDIPAEETGEDTSQFYTYLPEDIEMEDFSPYKLAFSADYIYGSGGYSSVYGASGDFNMALSDMLGDHRIYLYAYLYGDLLSSDAVVTYWFLKRRTDFAVGGFQLVDFYEYWTTDTTFNLTERARRGITTLVSFPLSKFFRLETGIDGMAVTYDEKIDCYFTDYPYYTWTEDTVYTNPLFQANAWLVFDNALWKYYTPMSGFRMRLGGYSSFLSADKYQTVQADFRGYLPITKRASIALRTYGVASFGEDREYYYLSGLGSGEYRDFSLFGGPYDVRGYYYDYFDPLIGSKAFFTNLELRVPFVDQLDIAFPLPLSLGGIRGVVFTDAGFVADEELPVLWEDGTLVDLKAGYGAGLRWLLGYFMLKFDFARPYQTDEEKPWKFHFRVGADF
ncbi:BamA/TamA family outer membrane protein [candidate division WOR-3 bacterium]|uniref:BamA/TamA family outer membrane protein n=1 Tax=candidate division WOR-3 bacterium TaxID=2052148 RepID=A0A9D5KA86_UNCW3|nr:BamA/TamA family outer membrane protein [candidate division WOR-3 bacterium]MBD3365198.1 BamA/TamA family outer membrane protein [candidate division WOR-3 bacterium]